MDADFISDIKGLMRSMQIHDTHPSDAPNRLLANVPVRAKTLPSCAALLRCHSTCAHINEHVSETASGYDTALRKSEISDINICFRLIWTHKELRSVPILQIVKSRMWGQT